MRIFKYDLHYHSVAELITLPKGAEIISWHEQSEQFKMWALVDENTKEIEKRVFMITPTGFRIPGKVLKSYGIQTLHDNSLILHLLELTGIKEGKGPTLANNAENDTRLNKELTNETN